MEKSTSDPAIHNSDRDSFSSHALVRFDLVRWPNLKRALLYSYASFDRATHFIIENYDNTIEIVEKEEDTFFDGYRENTYVYFTNRYLKYLIKGNTVVALKYH